MNKTILTAILFLCTLSFNCKNDNRPKIDVSEITKTDYVDMTLSQPDITDWTEDKTWTTDELNLFQTPTPDMLSGMEKAAVTIYPAFPNPVPGNSIIFNLNCSKPSFLQIVITDDMLNIKDRHFININSSAFVISLPDDKYLNNTNYRIYYGLYSAADGLYFKGHGDVRIQK